MQSSGKKYSQLRVAAYGGFNFVVGYCDFKTQNPTTKLII
jgi:hypothetical protein